MHKCCVTDCTNAHLKDTGSRFYDFPIDLQLRNIWLNRCGIKNASNIDINSLKVCSKHFMLGDFEEQFNNDYGKGLKYGALPTRNMPTLNVTPPYEIVKEHVDTSETLQSKINKLKQEKAQLTKKLKVYEQNMKIKQKNCATLKHKINKLRSSPAIVGGDRSLLSKVFSDAQIKILMGNKKVTWSEDDLAMAFSLRQMSSRDCYLYFKRFLNLPLPALACVQKWASANVT